MVAALLIAVASFNVIAREEKKKEPEPFKVEKITQEMGLYALGPVSPDGKQVALLARKQNQSPNLYVMTIEGFAITPPLTRLQWGAADPQWSPDAKTIAFAGFGETGTFSDLYIFDFVTKRLSQLTSNNFSDKEPAFSPDGKTIYFTTDESPLPDAAFGILHVAAIARSGGKSSFFTEEDSSSILPQTALNGDGLLLVMVDQDTGRHSLWHYGFDGRARRDLSGRKFARIRRYIQSKGSIIIWGQESPEQHDDVYILNTSTREATDLPDPDLVKRNPSVSPSGSRIAFIGPARSGAHVFLYDASNGTVQQLTSKGVLNHSPVFISEDRILFGSDRDSAGEGKEKNEIYVLDLSVPAGEKESKKK